MNNKDKILWITRTAILIALLIVLQAATATLGNSLITGSIVNMLLVISVMTCGLGTGLSVAIVSPVMAKFFGIGPLWALIPFISVGNIVLILVWHFIGNGNIKNHYVTYIATLVTAAIAKFLVLYIGIVQIAIPLLSLPNQQAIIISNMFSIPQLFTALIGGGIATVMLPTLKKAVKRI